MRLIARFSSSLLGLSLCFFYYFFYSKEYECRSVARKYILCNNRMSLRSFLVFFFTFFIFCTYYACLFSLRSFLFARRFFASSISFYCFLVFLLSSLSFLYQLIFLIFYSLNWLNYSFALSLARFFALIARPHYIIAYILDRISKLHTLSFSLSLQKKRHELAEKSA